MPIKSRENLVGAYAFLVSIILAVVVAAITIFLGPSESVSRILTSLLAILGLVAGYFVPEKDVQTFLFAAVSLVFVCFAGLQGGFLSAAVLGVVSMSKLLTNIFGALMFIFIPATIVVALKTVFSLAQT